MLLLAYLNLGEGVSQRYRHQNVTYHVPAQNYQPPRPYNNTNYPAHWNQTVYYQPSAPQPNYGFDVHYNSRPYRPKNSTSIISKLFKLG